jgi:opacity protein-like surface antigen
MKKLTIALVTLFLLATAAAPVFAVDRGTYEYYGALAYATGPENFDNGIGVSFGAGYMMKDIENLQARIDISYFTFDRDVANTNVDYTRIPVTISGRYYFPMQDRFNLFAEAGIEASFDDAEFADLGGVKHSDSEVNIGFTPGGGAEFFVNKNVSVFALARYHVITDDYFSMHLGGAFHF